MSDYATFLALKAQHGERSGFAPMWMPSFPFDFQSYLIDWNRS